MSAEQKPIGHTSQGTFHYRYGGSTAARTLNCPGWRALADTLPHEDNSSKFADDGTVCHDACELLHNDPGLHYDALMEKDVTCNASVLTDELLEVKVIPGYEAMEDILDEHDIVETWAERTVNINDMIGGSIDILGVNDKGTKLFVGDYKFGDGVMVYADDNSQALFYAWNAFDDVCVEHPDIEEVVLCIIQPSENRESYTDAVVVPAQRIFDFETEFLDAVAVAESTTPGENLCTGSHCKFCPAAVRCPLKTGQALAALQIDPTQLEIVDDILEALQLADELSEWIPAVKTFAHNQLDVGTEIPGWKLVAKRATRKWKDVSKVETYLKRKLKAANAMVSKVVTPAQAEKKAKELGIELDLEKHIVKESSGTNLVRASAKGEAVISQKALQASLESIS